MSDPDDIYHWHRIDARTTTSGQPSEAQLAELATLGVRVIINLAPHSHAKALPDEAARVRALGMDYLNIPVDFANPKEADFTAFCTAMAGTGDRPVHVHCAANYRVSAFFCRYRRDVLGISDSTARAEMTRIWEPDAVWTAFLRHRLD